MVKYLTVFRNQLWFSAKSNRNSDLIKFHSKVLGTGYKESRKKVVQLLRLSSLVVTFCGFPNVTLQKVGEEGRDAALWVAAPVREAPTRAQRCQP